MISSRLSPSSSLQAYLQRVRRRLRADTASRGVGATALGALLLTLVCVYIANVFAFSDSSIISSRTILFGSLLALLFFLLLRPLRRLGSKQTAVHLEKTVPTFDGRIETFVDRAADDDSKAQPNPFIDLLAEDTLGVAETVPAEQVVEARRIGAYVAGAVAAALLLVWLGTSGPGYWGYGTARLWGGWLRPGESPLYQVVVQPGDATVRQGADLKVSAQTVGFESPGAQLFAKFAGSVDWEEATMPRQFEGSGFEFLFAGVREPFHYYISAGGIRSEEFEVDVVEMPHVENLKLTYRYPDWTGLEDVIEDPGGDIRAVKGTVIEIEVETDKPLADGVLFVDGQETTGLSSDGLRSRGRLTISGDGEYYVAARYRGEAVRLTDDYFITVVPDDKPTIRVTRPGRDYKASNIEEVVTQFEASDDFGLKSFEVRYSVNGGEEQTVRLRVPAGAKLSRASHTLYLEEMGGEPGERGLAKLVPGDLISYYGIVRDHSKDAQTDMYFVEIQPYDREFFQRQQAGGMGGQQQMREEISRRQKEIIAATWNLIRKSDSASEAEKAEIRDNAVVLSDVQLTLRDQARKLAERARARELTGANKDFQAFVENLEKAAEYMEPAAERLGSQKLREAVSPEQKALQYIMRAESIFRQIQLSFGGGGGGGGGGQALDLAEMFEIEMDLHKNQYETGGGASAQQLEKEIDEALEKLRELAQRQEQLAERQRRQQTPSFAERWQQEMLRREAEELKRKLEQLERRQQAQAQSGQQQSGSQSGQQQSSGQPQSGQRSSGQRAAGGSQTNLQDIIRRLDQATREMQTNPAATQSGQRAGQQEASARRAQESLQQALSELQKERQRQAASALSDITQRAGRLAQEQAEVGERLKQDMAEAVRKLQSQGTPGRRARLSSGLTPQEALGIAERKAEMQQELESLEREMQQSIRRLGGQQKTSGKLREALGDLQQSEVGTKLGRDSEYIRRGYAPYTGQWQDELTRALQQLRAQAAEAEKLAGGERGGDEAAGLERALTRLENLRRDLERVAGMGEGERHQPGSGQQGQQQAQAGQQGRQGMQPGQQGQQGQRGQQGQAGQPGGQQGQQGQGSQGMQPSGQPGGQRQSAGGIGGRRGGPAGGPQRMYGSASNYGNIREPRGWGAWDPQRRQEMERALREGAGLVPRLTQQLRASGIYQEDLAEIRRFVRGLGDSRFPGNPELLTQEYRKMLALLEQLELQIRRQVEEEEGSQVRAIVAEPVPEQYREAVAEYFRRLSHGR